MLTGIFHATKIAVSMTVTLAGLGVAVAAPIAGILADKIGRKRVIVWSAFLLGVCSLAAATSSGLGVLLFWRFCQGLCTPGVFSVTVAYINDEWAGGGAGAVLSSYVSGTVLGGFSCRFISGVVASHLGWRWVFVVVGLLSLVVFWVRRSLLESPRWLADRGLYDEAEKVMTEIEAAVEAAASEKLPPPRPYLAETLLQTRNPFAVLLSRFYLRANIMAFPVWFFALLGYYGLTSWLAIILGQHGFSVVTSIGFITLITLGGIPGFYTAALLLESIGRKPTTALFLFMSALLAYIYGHAVNDTMLFISGFIMQFFMFGMWSCLYAYTPELYPTRARSTGAGMASAFGRLGAISGPIVVGYIIGAVGDTGVFSLGAASFAIAAVIVLTIGIETRGRTLEEICREEEDVSLAPTGKA